MWRTFNVDMFALPCCSLLALGGMLWFFGRTELYIKFAVPWIVSTAYTMSSNSVLQLVAVICNHSVQIVSDYVKSWKRQTEKHGQLDPRYFTNLLVVYNRLDHILMEVFAPMLNLLFLSASAVGAIGYFSLVIAEVCIRQRNHYAVVPVCVASGCLLAVMRQMIPLATVSDRCHSLDTLQKPASLFLEVLSCGEIEMNADESGDFLKVVHTMYLCPIGVKFPLLGLVTTSELKTAAKVVAAVVPAAVTWALSASIKGET